MKIPISLLMACCLAWAADQQPAEEKTVRGLVEQFNDAARKGDAATLGKLLSPDLAYSHSNAKMENRQECIDALVKGKPNFRMEPGWTVHLYGKTAIVRGHMTANVVQEGKANKIPLDILQVWVKEGKDWRMVARHTTRLPS